MELLLLYSTSFTHSPIPTMKIYLDGQLRDEADAKISVFDHGLLYGDGVFEGIRFYNGRVFKLEEHMDRLYDSAKVICLDIPMSQGRPDAGAPRHRARQRRTRRLHPARGHARGRRPGDQPAPVPEGSVIIISAKIKLYTEELYQNGLEIITCATRRMSSAAVSPAVKSLNYLNNIMAKIEALQANAAEALMLNEAGYIAECTADNFFLIKGGKLFTPPVSAGSLRGITRGTVLDLAEEIGHARQGNGTDPLRRVRGGRMFPDGHGAEMVGGGENRLARHRRWQARDRSRSACWRSSAHLTRSTGTPIFEETRRHRFCSGGTEFETGVEPSLVTCGGAVLKDSLFSRGNPHAM